MVNIINDNLRQENQIIQEIKIGDGLGVLLQLFTKGSKATVFFSSSY